MQTPAHLTDLLAKSDGETLYEHTWRVIERLVDQMRLRPHMPEQADSPRLWHWLSWACLLHDFGKAADGFQRMLRGGARWRHRHEVGSLAFLPWLFPDPAQEDYRWIVAAIVSHHKDANLIRELYRPGGDAVRDLAADIAAAPLDALWLWIDREARIWFDDFRLKDYGVEFPDLLPRDQAVALIRNRGVMLIEQALKTYRRFVNDLTTPVLRNRATITLALRGLIINADHSASAHTGSPPTLHGISASDVLSRLGWSPMTLYSHQTASAHAHDHVVLVAPTGSGKTEAALLWAFGAAQALPPVRIFYMLPFQASMNAMYTRLDTLFPGLVGLQHSRAVQALYRIAIEDGDDARFAGQRARMQKHRTELNYYPIRVLSPYQILKACYRLKGYETILSDLWHSAFILDEVHAYEPKRLALILMLARYLRQQYGARFFVMSATLPDLVKEALSTTLGAYQEIRATPETFQAFQRHQIHLLDGDIHEPRHVQRIAADAASGKSVLVCCNTVMRAQHMWRQLSQVLGPDTHVVLIHSRLTGRDRIERERIVQRACGMTTDQRQPVVLIATQVVEVSLNIDLDTIYTDLAPLEALIQRFGRVNRKQRRDANGHPMIAPVYVFREPIPEKNRRPYDLRLLRGALRLLEEKNGASIDESAVNEWLNRVYNDYAVDYKNDWLQEYDTFAREFVESILNPLVAFNADSDLEDLFYQAFDTIDVLPVRFEQEYFDLMNNGRFVEAESLMVSIAHWQYATLAQKGKIRRGNPQSDQAIERMTVALTEYDDHLGLLLFDDLLPGDLP